MSIIQRIPTGIPKLDDLIEGGFPSDSMILLVGYPGAGKTTFAGQFIYNGAIRYGAKSVYVCFAETKDTFTRNMLRFGWDFERLEKERRIAILDLAVSREAGLQQNLNTIMETMTSLNASRLVIDSFTAISTALEERIDIRVMLHLLYKFLKKAHCVSILVLDQPWGSTSIGEGIAEFLADGIIHLETYFDKDNKFSRWLRLLKMRGTNHTKVPHEYDISEDGFVILGKQVAAPTLIPAGTPLPTLIPVDVEKPGKPKKTKMETLPIPGRITRIETLKDELKKNKKMKLSDVYRFALENLLVSRKAIDAYLEDLALEGHIERVEEQGPAETEPSTFIVWKG